MAHLLIELSTTPVNAVITPSSGATSPAPFTVYFFSNNTVDVYLTTNGEDPEVDDPNTQVYETPFNITFTDTGVYIIKYFTMDSVGNRSEIGILGYNVGSGFEINSFTPKVVGHQDGDLIFVKGEGFGLNYQIVINGYKIPTQFGDENTLVGRLTNQNVGDASVGVVDPVSNITSYSTESIEFTETPKSISYEKPLEVGEERVNTFETTIGSMTITRKKIDDYSVDYFSESKVRSLLLSMHLKNKNLTPERVVVR